MYLHIIRHILKGFAHGGSLFLEMALLSSICHRYTRTLLQEMPVPARGPGPAGPLASSEAMSMHIDDIISTIASPFSKKITSICTTPFHTFLIDVESHEGRLRNGRDAAAPRS